MSVSRVEELQGAAEQSPTVHAYAALIEEELALLEAAEAARDGRAAALRRCDELETRVAELRVSAVPQQQPHMLSASAVCDYHREWVRILKEFVERKEMLHYFLSYSAADLKLADIGVAAHWLDTWGTFFSEAEAAVKALKQLERANPDVHLPPTRALYDALDEVCRLQLQARSLVGRERYRRTGFSEESVEDVMNNQEQLMSWCQKQRATLEGLSTIAEFSSFSNSFVANVPVMASNFLVLMDQCESLAANTRVQEAVEAVNKEWIELALLNYEKLQEAIKEEHRASPLESRCNGWIEGVGARVQDFLVCVCSLLSVEKGSFSDGATAGALLAKGEELAKEHDSHGIVSAHLGTFSIRQDCVQPHRAALMQELRAPATCTVLSFPNHEDYEGRTEYNNRIEELREWIDVKSQKGTYVKLLERLGETKVLIEEYADALFPDNEQSDG